MCLPLHELQNGPGLITTVNRWSSLFTRKEKNNIKWVLLVGFPFFKCFEERLAYLKLVCNELACEFTLLFKLTYVLLHHIGVVKEVEKPKTKKKS